MRQIPLFIIIFFSLMTLLSCKSIVPKDKNKFERGFYYQYDKLDFEQIANNQDTSWHNQIKPLADLIIKHPNWLVEIKTFLADSSTIEFNKRLDVIVCSNVRDYLLAQGVDPNKLIPKAYNNSYDSYRIVNKGSNLKKAQRRRHNKKDIFEWEIVRTD